MLFILLLLVDGRVLCEPLFNDTTHYGLSLLTDWNIRQEFQFKAILKTQRKTSKKQTCTTHTNIHIEMERETIAAQNSIEKYIHRRDRISI